MRCRMEHRESANVSCFFGLQHRFFVHSAVFVIYPALQHVNASTTTQKARVKTAPDFSRNRHNAKPEVAVLAARCAGSKTAVKTSDPTRQASEGSSRHHRRSHKAIWVGLPFVGASVRSPTCKPAFMRVSILI